MTDPADLAHCRALLRDGSRTFLAASLLLPRSVRDAACILYAFCRLADDAVDRSIDAPAAVAAVRERLDAVYRGAPHDHAADRALAVVVVRYGIARELPEALVEGFAWDAEGRRYETLEELHAYAARVAGSVGAMMALLMGARTPAALARACDLGVAMQLSNIARDVGEDARMGRLYLPRAWMRDSGLDPDAWLRAPVHSVALGRVVRRLLDAADVLYARVGVGVAQLPPTCRPGISAARHLYAEIGNEVARRGLDAVSQRAVVSSGRKARVLVASTFDVAFQSLAVLRRHAAVEPLAATRFLVEAAATATPVRAQPTWNPVNRAVRTIELFERLGRQDRDLRRTSGSLMRGTPS